METLEQYKNRVYCFMREKLSDKIPFKTNAGLSKKVWDDGSFRVFVGDTVVFELDEKTQQKIGSYQKLLYEDCHEMLAERINPETFHVTLHDLNSGEPSEELWKISQQTYWDTENILREFPQAKEIRLKPVAVFNMMNTSIVLGLEPENEQSCVALMQMYEELQQVVRLNYPLTLHVTLAYFKPGVYGTELVRRMNETLQRINGAEMPVIELDMQKLCYQRFDDMNHYYNIEN